jgi:hypothetical protein
MLPILKGKEITEELSSGWRQFIGVKGLTTEYTYRLEKLALKLDSIADKLFLKTVKAHLILNECKQLTKQFKSELLKSNNKALHLLTRLEMHMDDLVKTTHEFRIKAG